jgi:hypothetical protein
MCWCDLLGGFDQETWRSADDARQLRPALIFADAVLRPKEKTGIVYSSPESQQSPDEPAYVAATVAMRSFFGDFHPTS